MNYIRSEESQTDCIYSIEVGYDEVNLSLGFADVLNVFITCMQKVSVADQCVRSSLVKILHHLYNNDVLSEEVILEWHRNPKTAADDDQDDLATRQSIRKQVTSFITWLQEAEEESESD